MSYRNQLYPWCIVRLITDPPQQLPVHYFRRRNDAEAHLRVLRHMNPAFTYRIVFDATMAQLADSDLDDRKTSQ